jgi:hypothetical protein
VTRLWFVVPAHERFALTDICLRLLAQTCEQMEQYEIEATAVVIADDENLDVARELGFATVYRDNEFVGRKLNDGYQLACDPDYNPEPADYVVALGSDDWVDPSIFARLPSPATVGIFNQIAVVDEKRERLAQVTAPYTGGWGIRIYSSMLMAATNYRPCQEDRKQSLDSSTIEGVKRALRHFPELEALDVHPLQIVDWKSENNLHPYRELASWAKGPVADPFEALAGFYPAWALEQMELV